MPAHPATASRLQQGPQTSTPATAYWTSAIHPSIAGDLPPDKPLDQRGTLPDYHPHTKPHTSSASGLDTYRHMGRHLEPWELQRPGPGPGLPATGDWPARSGPTWECTAAPSHPHPGQSTRQAYPLLPGSRDEEWQSCGACYLNSRSGIQPACPLGQQFSPCRKSSDEGPFQ